MTRTSLGALLAAAIVLSFSGCKARLYRGETVLHADGSVSRAIYQPVAETPAAALDATKWEKTTYAKRIGHEAWNGPIDRLPKAQRDDDRDYFAAWGTFESPTRMPQAFVRSAPEGFPDGTLQVAYDRHDFVFVVEHDWSEMLTDIVSLGDMHKARRELADLLVPLAEKILEEALGEEYETAGLVEWLRATATPWAFELSDVLFDWGARGQSRSSDQAFAAVEPICVRYGLPLRDGSGRMLEDELFQSAVLTYAADVVRSNLHRRDGEPVADEVVDELLEWIGIKERPEGIEGSPLFDDAAKKVVRETYGSQESFEAAVKPLVMRIFGLYQSEFLAAPHHFYYTLEMPGAIVTTNGVLLSDRLARWEFAASEAYPFGYAMNCVALVPRTDVQKKLLGDVRFEDRAAMLKYLELASADEEVLDALRACAAAESMQPFYAARDAAAPASKTLEAFNAMSQLLDRPREPAGG